MTKTWIITVVASLALAGACKSKSEGGDGNAQGGDSPKVGGDVIKIDGSSTVFPITQAVAEEFQKARGGRVTIGVSGTGGGFKKFCRKETAMTGASRPIGDTEVELCKTEGVDVIELPVAYDGISVVVHKSNDWASTMTVEELKKLWEPEAQDKIKKWSQVREGWPDSDIHLFGPGVDSGTYDYFTAAIVGTEHASRGDFTSSEDDNVLVQGVASDPAALGFFGYAYYVENQDKLKLIGVDDGNPDNGDGPIQPSPETVENGTYQPLSRPVFIYVSVQAAERAEVAAFIEFFLTEGAKLAAEVGYVAMPAKTYQLVQDRFNKRTTGSVFHGSKVGVTVEDLLGGS